MKTQPIARFIALAATVAFMVTGFSSVLAESNAATANTSKTLAQVLDEDYAVQTKGDLTKEQCKTAILTEAEVPETLSLQQAKEKKHVKRLYEQETQNNTVIFQNEDGTKAMYYYSYPVKYIDETGQIKDKSNKIVPLNNKKRESALEGYQYQNEGNDIIAYFPQKLSKSKGIKLQYKNIHLELTPEQAAQQQITSIEEPSEESASLTPFASAAPAQQSNSVKDVSAFLIEEPSLLQNTANITVEEQLIGGGKIQLKNIKYSKEELYAAKETAPKAEGKHKDTVNYKGAFGNETELVYKPTLNGIKEDIVLNSYTGQNTFIFTLKTGGLRLVQENGEWLLKDEQGESIGTLGKIFTNDSTPSNPKTTIGEIDAQVIEEDQIYRLFVSVDQGFLTDPATTYPVIIDPTIEVHGYSQTIVEDTTIYSGGDHASGTGVLYTGSFKYPGMGNGRSLVRFNYLKDNGVCRAIMNGYITPDLVKLFISGEAGPNLESNIKAYAPPSDEYYSWNEYSAVYNSTLWNGYSKFLDSKPFTKDYIIDLDITTLFRGWMNGTANLDSGLQLRSSQEGVYNTGVALYSREAADAGKRPHLFIQYHNNDDWWQGAAITRVPYEVQHASNWCWNACARMTARSQAAAPLATQEEMANNILGWGNRIRNVYQVTTAVNTYMGYPNYYKGLESTLTQQELIDNLDYGYPVIILRIPESGKVGHFYIIFGYHYNSSNNTFYFMLFDPFNPNLGQTSRGTFQLSYSQLLNEQGQTYTKWKDTVYRNW